MFNKLRQNYQLSNLLVKIFFVLSFVFCNWQNCLASTLFVLGTTNLWLALAAALLLGVVLVLVLPALVNFALNLMRLYNIPRAEYCLLATLFLGIYMFACGVLGIVNFFTPLLLTWGAVLFPVVASLVCIILFYKVTVKLYFNEVTAPYYFKMLAIAYVVCLVLFGVVL